MQFLELQDSGHKETGWAYLFFKAEEDSAPLESGKYRLVFEKSGHSKPYLGLAGWQISEYAFDLDAATESGGTLKITLGPKIVAFMQDGNYQVTVMSTSGQLLLSFTLRWRGVRGHRAKGSTSVIEQVDMAEPNMPCLDVEPMRDLNQVQPEILTSPINLNDFGDDTFKIQPITHDELQVKAQDEGFVDIGGSGLNPITEQIPFEPMADFEFTDLSGSQDSNDYGSSYVKKPKEHKYRASLYYKCNQCGESGLKQYAVNGKCKKCGASLDFDPIDDSLNNQIDSPTDQINTNNTITSKPKGALSGLLSTERNKNIASILVILLLALLIVWFVFF